MLTDKMMVKNRVLSRGVVETSRSSGPELVTAQIPRIIVCERRFNEPVVFYFRAATIKIM